MGKIHFSLFLIFAFLAYLCFLFVDYQFIAWFDQGNFLIWKNIFNYFSVLGDGRFALSIIIFLFVLSWSLQFFALKNFSPIQIQQWRKKLVEQSKTLFLFLLLGGIIIRILKITIGRVRPTYFLEAKIQKFDTLNIAYPFSSFPSGHTQTVTTLMLCLILFYPKYKWFFYTLIFLGATSRIILLAHYFSDVVIGCYIGVICAMLAHRFYQTKISNIA